MLVSILGLLLACAGARTPLGVPVFRFPALRPSGATVYVMDRVGGLERYSHVYRDSVVVTPDFLDSVEARKKGEGPLLPELAERGSLLPPCEGRYELTCIEETGLEGGGRPAEELIARARETADVVYTAWAAEEAPLTQGNDWAASYPFSVSLVVCILLIYMALALWPVLSVRDIDAFPETDEKDE